MPRIKLHMPQLWFLPVLLLVMLVLVLLLLLLLLVVLLLVRRLPFHAAPPNLGPQRPQTLPLALE